MDKKTVNLTVPQPLLAPFDAVCARYGHGKQKGMVLSAAILMFLEAEEARQAAFVKRIAVAQIDGHLTVAGATQAVHKPGTDAGADTDTDTGTDTGTAMGTDDAATAGTPHRPRLAARKVRAASRKGRRALPPAPPAPLSPPAPPLPDERDASKKGR